MLPAPPLLLISDRHQAADLVAVFKAAAAAGGRWFSLREKDLPLHERRALLHRLVAATPQALWMVHDDIDAAAELGLGGVHLPAGSDPAVARRRLGARSLIGVSAHSVEAARAAAERGADYVTLSPIFLTASKPGYGPALGPAVLGEAARAAGCPVIALGGIDAASAGACRAAGAAGVAVMGEVMRAADPRASMAALLSALAAAAQKSRATSS